MNMIERKASALSWRIRIGLREQLGRRWRSSRRCPSLVEVALKEIRSSRPHNTLSAIPAQPEWQKDSWVQKCKMQKIHTYFKCPPIDAVEGTLKEIQKGKHKADG